MLQNIIDNLKNQGIEPDLAQSNLIEELKLTTQITLTTNSQKWKIIHFCQ